MTYTPNYDLDHSQDLAVSLFEEQLWKQPAKSLYSNANWLDCVSQLFTAKYPDIASACGDRITAAKTIALWSGNIYATPTPGIYNVRSSRGNNWYQVDTINKSCTCPDHYHNQTNSICKHRLAVGFLLFGSSWIEDENHKRFPTWITEETLREAKCKMLDAWEYHSKLSNKLYEVDMDKDYTTYRKLHDDLQASAAAAKSAQSAYETLVSTYNEEIR